MKRRTIAVIGILKSAFDRRRRVDSNDTIFISRAFVWSEVPITTEDAHLGIYFRRKGELEAIIEI